MGTQLWWGQPRVGGGCGVGELAWPPAGRRGETVGPAGSRAGAAPRGCAELSKPRDGSSILCMAGRGQAGKLGPRRRQDGAATGCACQSSCPRITVSFQSPAASQNLPPKGFLEQPPEDLSQSSATAVPTAWQHWPWGTGKPLGWRWSPASHWESVSVPCKARLKRQHSSILLLCPQL